MYPGCVTAGRCLANSGGRDDRATTLPVYYRTENAHGNLPDALCGYCGGVGEIETDNNGPIGRCPVCNGSGQLAAAILKTPNTKISGACVR